MPEIIEVLITSQFLNYKIKNKKIKEIILFDEGKIKNKIRNFDKLILNLPLKVAEVSSKGKMLYFVLKDNDNNKYYLISTFGLFGRWFDSDDDLKHKRLMMKFDKINIYYDDRTNYGNMYFYDDKKEFLKKIESIAPDFLRNDLNLNIFKSRIEYLIKNKKMENKKIYEILMNQEKGKSLGSGLGNYLTAEILYDAKISPHTKLKDIYSNTNLIKKLMNSIKKIIKHSYVSSTVGYLEYLSTFKKDHRKMIKENHFPNFHPETKIPKKDFKFKIYGQDEDPYGNKVVKDVIINGRKTHWVKEIQV